MSEQNSPLRTNDSNAVAPPPTDPDLLFRLAAAVLCLAKAGFKIEPSKKGSK